MKFGLVVLSLIVASCSTAPLTPIDVRSGEDACAHCRMTIVSITTAAQIVRRGDDAVMFDDVGCLRDYLVSHPLAEDAVAFVADHRSGDWVDARSAVFTRSAQPSPMGSGLLAHRDESSRELDPATAQGEQLGIGFVFSAGSGGIK